MDGVEQNDIEATSVHVVFDCGDNSTKTGATAKALKDTTWQGRVVTLHNEADETNLQVTEVQPHSVSNPMYAAIVAQIPVP